MDPCVTSNKASDILRFQVLAKQYNNYICTLTHTFSDRSLRGMIFLKDIEILCSVYLLPGFYPWIKLRKLFYLHDCVPLIPEKQLFMKYALAQCHSLCLKDTIINSSWKLALLP